MKRIVSIVLLMISLAAVSFAQTEGRSANKKQQLTPVEKADKRTKKLDSICDLTADQEKKVNQILIPHFAKVNKVRRELPGKENKDKRRSRLKPLRKETRKKIGSVLTAEQKEKLKAYRQAKRAANNGTAADDEL